MKNIRFLLCEKNFASSLSRGMQHRLVQENVFTKIHTMIYIEKKKLVW